MKKKNIKNQNTSTTLDTLKLRQAIRCIFSLLQIPIFIYFFLGFFTGVTNKITNGYLFEYVSWIKLVFYITSAITSFYFFATTEPRDGI